MFPWSVGLLVGTARIFHLVVQRLCTAILPGLARRAARYVFSWSLTVYVVWFPSCPLMTGQRFHAWGSWFIIAQTALGGHLFSFCMSAIIKDDINSLLASEVNPAMVSTVRLYDRNELYGSPDVRNCRMPNFLGWAFFVISLISIN